MLRQRFTAAINSLKEINSEAIQKRIWRQKSEPEFGSVTWLLSASLKYVFVVIDVSARSSSQQRLQ